MDARAALRLQERGEGWGLVGESVAGFGLVDEYLSHLLDRNYSRATVRAYGYDLLAFCRWLSEQDVDLAAVDTTVRQQAAAIAEAAARERLTHSAYLAEVLSAECDDREARRRIRRVKEAKFPRLTRLEDFNTSHLPDLPAATLAHLAGGAWIDAGEPLVLAPRHHREEGSRHHLTPSPPSQTEALLDEASLAARHTQSTTRPGVGPNQTSTVGPNGVVIPTGDSSGPPEDGRRRGGDHRPNDRQRRRA